MNEKRVTLDLCKDSGIVQEVRVGRGDVRGLTLVATIRDNGIPADLTGMTASLRMRVGSTSVSVPCEVSGSQIACVLDAHAIGGTGSDFAYVAIQDGDRAYSTERMRVVVVDGNDS